MAYVHIAHDCRIGNYVVMANVATLAGSRPRRKPLRHRRSRGGPSVHKDRRLRDGRRVQRHRPWMSPYMMASGARSKLYGLNVIGLKRHGFSEETINLLKKAYKILFREKRTLRDALKKIKSELPESKEIRHLVEFIEQNKRGICR
ncbi:MAG: hypothetical protein MZV70_59465 [Desulfobacterales bacterium]|nr:hypothetical protein [Desulfobacterales bacterium]